MHTENQSSATAVRVVLTGRVQGVGMRYATQDQAQKLGLVGWVRNRSDGSVEAWLEGADASVQLMLDWLRADPGWSRVDGCTVAPQAPAGHTEFKITS